MVVNNSLSVPMESDAGTTRLNDRYSVIHLPGSEFSMCGLGTYPYHTFPGIYTLNSNISLEQSGINVVRNNPNLSLFGQGILIGLVDTGLEYRHEAFLNPDGSTRLFSIWDQTITDGEPPAGFTFGTEYNKTMINMALRTQEPLAVVPSIDELGHGTMLAGIAAGSRRETDNFSGVAPEAELVVVKLPLAKQLNRKIFSIPSDTVCYQESNIIIGIEYVLSIAQRLNRPLLICIGMGSSQSSHDGLGLFAGTLNQLSALPRIGCCVAAGNEGNLSRHYHGTFTDQIMARTFELRVGEKDKNFFMEIWQRSPGRLMIGISAPTGETFHAIMPGFSECREYKFLFNPTKIYINNIIVEEESGDQLILIRFNDAVNGIWTIRVNNIETIAGDFNAWLPAGNIISKDTYFLEPDPDNTITSPGNARNPMTVTAYNQINNGILPESGRGYTTSGLVEPDIAAPGFALSCPTIAGTNTYGSVTGTGAAAAHAAGAAALLMEWAVLRGNYTTITGRDINRLFIRGAIRDKAVVYPNNVWGYGRLDLMGVLSSLV